MENWHLVESQKKSGDYVSHVVKLLLFTHLSVDFFSRQHVQAAPFCAVTVTGL